MCDIISYIMIGFIIIAFILYGYLIFLKYQKEKGKNQ